MWTFLGIIFIIVTAGLAWFFYPRRPDHDWTYMTWSAPNLLIGGHPTPRESRRCKWCGRFDTAKPGTNNWENFTLGKGTCKDSS